MAEKSNSLVHAVIVAMLAAVPIGGRVCVKLGDDAARVGVGAVDNIAPAATRLGDDAADLGADAARFGHGEGVGHADNLGLGRTGEVAEEPLVDAMDVAELGVDAATTAADLLEDDEDEGEEPVE